MNKPELTELLEKGKKLEDTGHFCMASKYYYEAIKDAKKQIQFSFSVKKPSCIHELLDSYEHLERLYWDLAKIKELKFCLVEMTNELCAMLQQFNEFPEYLIPPLIEECQLVQAHFPKLAKLNPELSVICQHLKNALKSSLKHHFLKQQEKWS